MSEADPALPGKKAKCALAVVGEMGGTIPCPMHLMPESVFISNTTKHTRVHQVHIVQ